MMRVRMIRKVHRLLGLVIGIQLLFWTLGGLVFSWNDIHKVRGEDLIRRPECIQVAEPYQGTLGTIIERLKQEGHADTIRQITLRSVATRPVYEVTLDGDDNHEAEGKSRPPRFVVFDAKTGTKLTPISKQLAMEVAKADFVPDAPIKSIEQIDSAGSHSEYRGKELPAYRVVLDHPTGTVIYVSVDRALVTARRNNRWRLFDFFWMLHTMDYQGRDNFNSWILRTFSIFGVVTVVSGFVLGAATSPLFRNRRKAASFSRE